MVDHFHEQVLALNKIGGQARAMVVTSGIERAIQYFHAFKAYLAERKSPYQAIVAFSGEHEYGGAKVTEASLNGFPEQRDRGQDSGRPVSLPDLRRQVPDRLRRAAAAHDVRGQAALRHQGGADALAPQPRAPAEARRASCSTFRTTPRRSPLAFSDYYRTTILSEETDPNKLHDLKAALDGHQVYAPEQVRAAGGLVPRRRTATSSTRSSTPASRSTKTARRGRARWTSRARPRRSAAPTASSPSILPYTNAEWEKLSIFLNFLMPKLPAPKEEDLAKGILEAIDMDSYRVEKKAAVEDPAARRRRRDRTGPDDRRRRKPEPELDRLSNILQGLQRPVREHPVDRRRPGAPAHHGGDPGEGGRRRRLPERQQELRQTERPHRARQGAGARHDGRAEGRHGAFQAVQRQRCLLQPCCRREAGETSAVSRPSSSLSGWRRQHARLARRRGLGAARRGGRRARAGGDRRRRRTMGGSVDGWEDARAALSLHPSGEPAVVRRLRRHSHAHWFGGDSYVGHGHVGRTGTTRVTVGRSGWAACAHDVRISLLDDLRAAGAA